MDICSLPTPILASIACILPIQSVIALSSTSQKIRELVNGQFIWVELCERDFGKEVRELQHQFKEWRLLYQYLVLNSEDFRIKVVAVGDGAVGKTSLLITYALDTFPTDYVPTVFENYTVTKKKGLRNILVHLWDTAGPEEYDRLRPLSYPGADVVLMLFSTVSKASYIGITQKWAPEVNHYIPGVPIFLIGTKIDLRENQWPDPNSGTFDPITFQMGQSLAKEIKAEEYLEISSKTKQGVQEAFEKAIDFILKRDKKPLSMEDLTSLKEKRRKKQGTLKLKNCITM